MAAKSSNELLQVVGRERHRQWWEKTVDEWRMPLALDAGKKAEGTPDHIEGEG